jgi:arabinofuranan 3-O-arabinosyltransferase
VHAARPKARVRWRCGDLAGSVRPFGAGGASGAAPATPFRLRVSATVAELDAGAPLRARSCGPALRLPARTVALHLPSGDLRPLVLRLDGPPTAAIQAAATGASGSVLDPGKMGRGTYKDVRVEVHAPSWLVLGESYSRGWQAKCDGHSLGEPRVVDGFANGWHVSPGCHDLSFAFAPQRAVWWGYGIGALAILVALAVLLFRRPRRTGAPAPPAPPELPVDDAPWRLPLRRAIAAGLVAGVVLGFAFALRAGIVIAPAVALLLSRGVTPRTLIAAAGALLTIVVPAIYLIFQPRRFGGYNPGYAVELIGAHWVAVGAVTLLILALARVLNTATRRGRPARAADDRPAARASA